MVMKPPPKRLDRNRTVDPLQTKSFWKFPIDEPITTNSGVTDGVIGVSAEPDDSGCSCRNVKTWSM